MYQADASGTVSLGLRRQFRPPSPSRTQTSRSPASWAKGKRRRVRRVVRHSTCCSLRISILKPNGAILITPVSVGSNGGFLDEVVLPTTGTYTLFVDPQGPVNRGARRSRALSNVPADAAATIVPGERTGDSVDDRARSERRRDLRCGLQPEGGASRSGRAAARRGYRSSGRKRVRTP